MIHTFIIKNVQCDWIVNYPHAFKSDNFKLQHSSEFHPFGEQLSDDLAKWSFDSKSLCGVGN